MNLFFPSLFFPDFSRGNRLLRSDLYLSGSARAGEGSSGIGRHIRLAALYIGEFYRFH